TLLECLGQLRREGFGIVGRRVAVAFLERVGQRAGGEVVQLLEHTACGLLVRLCQHTATEPLLHLKYLEQVELEVSDIAFVVPHGAPPSHSVSPAEHWLLAGNHHYITWQ